MTVRMFVAGTFLLSSTMSFAQSADSSDQQANKHYENGRIAFDQHRADEAIAEFAAAYAIKPHPNSLYGLGSSYAMARRPAKAVETLRRFLDQARRLPRREQSTTYIHKAETLIKEQTRFIAYILIRASPPGAVVRLDEESIQSGIPVAIDVGRQYKVLATLHGHTPHEEKVQVSKVEKEPVLIDIALTATPQPSTARLSVRSALRGVQIIVDGQPRGQTPLSSPMEVDAGEHQVSCSRLGYTNASHRAFAQPGSTTVVSCALRRRHDVPGTARLSIETSEPGAEILLDGELFVSGDRAPAGPHEIVIRRAEFHTWKRDTDLIPGSHSQFLARLVPTAEYVGAYRRRIELQRRWALGLGLGGAGLAIASGALLVWSHVRYQSWKRESSALDVAFAQCDKMDACTAPLRQRESDNMGLLSSIHVADEAGLGFGIAAASLLAAGAATFFTAGNPKRYDIIGLIPTNEGLKAIWMRQF